MRNSKIKYSLLTPHAGAEIHDIDLASGLTDEEFYSIYRILLKYKVIFFRDQNLDRQQHLSFSKLFGTPEISTYLHLENFPEITPVYYEPGTKLETNIWHSDASFMGNPTSFVVLKAVDIPKTGGDTLFSNMAEAYKQQRPEIKSRIRNRYAYHYANKMVNREKNRVFFDQCERDFPKILHPIVWDHPETGEEILYVNDMYTSEIVDTEEESRYLLDYLISQARVPEYQVRFRWSPNAIVVWDNRSTQHYACSDYGQSIRRLERIGIAGTSTLSDP